MSLIYWATILAACSIGETCADLVSHELGLGYVRASALFVAAFIVLVAVERKARIRNEARYWVAIAIMSTTGTALADLFTRTLELGYAGTSLLLGVLFCGVLIGWNRVKHIAVVRRADAADPLLPHVHVHLEHTELPDTDAGYWAAIMVASTLGTSLGDFVSNVMDVGFGGGTLLLGSVLAAVLVAEHLAASSNVARYWAALVTTSTIGATSGDYLTKANGLGFPFSGVIAVQVVVFVALILLGSLAAARSEAAVGERERHHGVIELGHVRADVAGFRQTIASQGWCEGGLSGGRRKLCSRANPAAEITAVQLSIVK